MDRRRSQSRNDAKYGLLELAIRDILTSVKPTDEDRQMRFNIINEFRAVVQSVQSLRGATVEPFGSYVSNLYNRWGDLDISIDVSSGSLVPSAKKRQKQILLRDVMRALQRSGRARSSQFIPTARVPLLIFQSNYRHISCDISVCNIQGQMKSKFLLWITEIDERFRDMVLLIKEWAKAKNINDPKSGTLNSYSLCLLVIFHFQTCSPPILPPLEDVYDGNIAVDLTGMRQRVERNIQETCATNLARFRSQALRHVNQSSLCELFVSFFEKFSTIGDLVTEYAICPFIGNWKSKRSNEKWMQKRYQIVIEDPFEHLENVTRAVDLNGLTRITEAFEETHRILSSSTYLSHRNALIANLARPLVSESLSERNTQGRSSGFNPHSPLPSAIMTPTQDLFTRALRLESHPSSSTTSFQRPRTVQMQSQQHWRHRNP